MTTKPASLFPAFFTLALCLSPLNLKADKPVAYVPAPPYEFLVEQVGGDLIEVHSIAGPGDDPHNYSPTPKQVVAISQCNLLFSGHLSYEGNFFVRLGDGTDAPREVNLLEGLNLLEGSCEICEAESTTPEKGDETKEGDKHQHNHEDLKDPHVWLSPAMLRQQAEHIAEVLKEHLPRDQHAIIDENLAALTGKLEGVDQELKEALAPLKGEKFYVYHGAFAYFAQQYGLEQVAIEIGNRKPTPRQIVEITKEAQESKVRLIFVQPQFDQSSARTLAEAIDGEVALMDPLEKDVINNLRKIAGTLKEAFGVQGTD